jgi:hypothetical protein
MCRHIRELISTLIDGEAQPEEKSEVRNHVQDCTSCSEYLALQERVRINTLHIPPLAHEEVEDRLRMIIPVKKKRGRNYLISFLPLRPALAGGMAIIFLGFLIFFGAPEWRQEMRIAEYSERMAEQLTPEERELIIYMGEKDGKGDEEEEEFLKMLQELEELDTFFSKGKMNT